MPVARARPCKRKHAGLQTGDETEAAAGDETSAPAGDEPTAVASHEATAANDARWDSDDPTRWGLDRGGNLCRLGFLFRPASFRPDLAQWRELPGQREHWYLPDGTPKPLWMLKRDAARYIRFKEEVRTACRDGDADGNVLRRLEEMARQVEEMQVASGEPPTPGGVTLHQGLAASGGSAGGETPAATGAETLVTASSEPPSVAGESAGESFLMKICYYCWLGWCSLDDPDDRCVDASYDHPTYDSARVLAFGSVCEQFLWR
jgi:hypothetical protein